MTSTQSRYWHYSKLEIAEAKTHALIIAIGDYTHFPSPGTPTTRGFPNYGMSKLPGAVIGAWNFGNWLRDPNGFNHEGAPIGTIDLLLSPTVADLDANQHLNAASDSFLRATTNNVREAVYDWKRKCSENPNNVGIMYVCGHGVQLGKDDYIVLLEDFGSDENQPLLNSIDIGLIHKGMIGETVASKQFYFVDACRISPEEFRAFENLGHGISISVPNWTPDRRSAPIYGCAPGTASYGGLPQGTIFSRALLTCLRGDAATCDDAGKWSVTVSSLIDPLNERVSFLSGLNQKEQTIAPGGLLKPGVIQNLISPPVVSVSFNVNPEPARHLAVADLFEGDREECVFQNESFRGQELKKTLDAGLYSLDVRTPNEASGHYLPKLGVAIHVNARGNSKFNVELKTSANEKPVKEPK